jgi:hypothetical protein
MLGPAGHLRATATSRPKVLMSRRALAVLANCGPRARCLQSVHALDQEPDAKAQAKDNLAVALRHHSRDPHRPLATLGISLR